MRLIAGVCRAAVLSFGMLLASGPISAQTAPSEHARMLRGQGQYGAAIDALRAALRARPDDVALREDLGYVLLLDGQMAAAQYQFTLLSERVADPQLRALYHGVLRRITAERPVGISLIFSFTPTSNLNQGTDATTVSGGVLGVGTVDPESRRISGWSSQIGLRGYVRGNIGAQGQLRFDWRVAREFYSDIYTPSTEKELALQYNRDAVRFGWGVRGFAFRYDGDQAQYDHTGAAAFGSYKITDKLQLDARLRLSLLDFPAGDTRGGPQVLFASGVQFTPRPSTALRFGMQITHAQADRVSLRNTGLAFTARAIHAFGNGYEVSADAILGHRSYKEDLGFSRSDSFGDLSVTVFNSRYSLGGIVPKLTCGIGRTRSNVVVFDTRRRSCGVSLSRQF